MNRTAAMGGDIASPSTALVTLAAAPGVIKLSTVVISRKHNFSHIIYAL